VPEQDPLSAGFYETSEAAIAQGAAGTTSIVTGVTGKKVYVTGYSITLDAAGTLKFTETAGDLTGPLSIALDGGLATSGGPHPVLWTSTAGEALKITTVTGKANGWITYFVT